MSAIATAAAPKHENAAMNVVRAAAAMLVAVGHLRVLFFQDYGDTAQSPIRAAIYAPLSLGHEAVIVFFVLSGYWVGGGALASIREGRFTWTGYGTSRLTRLWLVLIPALCLTLVLDSVGGWLMPGASIYSDPGTYAVLPDSPDYSFATFLGNVGFIQGLHMPVFGLNGPLWSLAYEFWYYILFPSALLACRYGATTRVRVVSGLGLAVAISVGGGPALQLFSAWLLGVAVAWKASRIIECLRKLGPRSLGAAQFLAVSTTLAAMVLVHQVGAPNWAEAIIIGIPAAGLLGVLATGTVWAGWPARALDQSARLAHSSFSLYAVHVPVLALIAAAVVPDADDRWTMDPLHALAGLVLLIMVVGLGVAFAYFTEMRTDAVRRWLRARRPLRRRPPVASKSPSRPGDLGVD